MNYLPKRFTVTEKDALLNYVLEYEINRIGGDRYTVTNKGVEEYILVTSWRENKVQKIPTKSHSKN